MALKRLLFTASFLGGLLGVAPLCPANAQTALEKLQADFVQPPAGAKPMMRWWWFGLAVEKPEIRRELEQMKADGIGGVELAFVYPQVLDNPAKGLVNEPFLSGPMLEKVAYAASEGRRLGLRVDVTLGSGWPYGGPATTLAEAAGCLRIVDLTTTPGGKSAHAFLYREGESLIYRSGSQAFLASHPGQRVKRASVGAEGWVLDPFSHEAVATHLQAVGEPLVKLFGGMPPY